MLLDKPPGVTSHDVVRTVRRMLRTRAVGHTGTLDPFATGLLVVLVGGATRLARFVEGRQKRYLAVARLGFATATDDFTGEPLAGGISREVSRTELDVALQELSSTRRQRPPTFSAKHVAGERSHRLARRGTPAHLPDVAVEIHTLELVEHAGDRVTFRTTVSPGTYVRAMARDLGERLGTGAHLVALRRESIGDLEVADAIGVDQVAEAALQPPLRFVRHLPARELDDAELSAVRHGRTVPWDVTAEPVAVLHGGRLVAIGAARDGLVQPRVVLPGE